jgi:hypothetical protein
MRMIVRAIRAGRVSVGIAAVLASGVIACGEDEIAPPAPVKPDTEEEEESGRDAGPGPGDAGGDSMDAGGPSVGRCDDELNPYSIAAPTEFFEVDDFRFELASDALRSVTGTVVDSTGVDNPGVITRAVLLATGAFLDEGCVTTQNGTSFRWQGVACQAGEGTLFNVMVVEPVKLAGFSGEITGGKTYRLTGYEIERYNDFSPGGGYWQDGGDDGATGQVSLWLTDICKPK